MDCFTHRKIHGIHDSSDGFHVLFKNTIHIIFSIDLNEKSTHITLNMG